jgi:hypothetical protein
LNPHSKPGDDIDGIALNRLDQIATVS